MNVDSLEQGIVIDHIQAGKSMEIYKIMQLGKLDCSVAIIKNAKCKKKAYAYAPAGCQCSTMQKSPVYNFY